MNSNKSPMANGHAITEELSNSYSKNAYTPLMRRDCVPKHVIFCSHLQEKLKKCRSELDTCRAQRNGLLNSNQDLEARLRNSEEKLQQTMETIAGLEQDLESCKVKLQLNYMSKSCSQVPETFSLQKEVDEMKASFYAKAEILKKVVEEIAQTNSNVNQEQINKKNKSNELAELLRNLADCRRNYTAKEEECVELERHLIEARSDIFLWQQKLADSEAQISKLEIEEKFKSVNDEKRFVDLRKELKEAKMEAQEANNARNLICQTLKDVLNKEIAPISHGKRLLPESEQELKSICETTSKQYITNISDTNKTGNQLSRNNGSRKEISTASSTTASTQNKNRPHLDPRIKAKMINHNGK